jgi:hypothetical protein
MTWPEVLRHNGWQALIHFDQGLGLIVSTLLKEKGYGDLTLSANAWRWHVEGTRHWPRRLIDALFWWQDGHCKSSYEYEVQRRHLPESMR